MRAAARILLASILWLVLQSADAIADGGTVRLSEVRAGYRITVFTSPTPWRAGPVDISVLVQDAASGEPVPDAKVELCLTQVEGVGSELRYTADSEMATNKLFHAAQFDLPGAGVWTVAVTVAGSKAAVATQFEIEAAPPLPAWLSLAGWISWPILPVLVFVIHQLLVRRKAKAAGPVGSKEQSIQHRATAQEVSLTNAQASPKLWERTDSSAGRAKD